MNKKRDTSHCHSKKYFRIEHYSGIDCNYHIFSLKLDSNFFLTFYFQRNEMKGNIQTKKLNSRTEIECLELYNVGHNQNTDLCFRENGGSFSCFANFI